MAESQLYEAARGDPDGPRQTPPLSQILHSIWSERTALLQIVGITISGVVVFYTWFIFAPSYLTTVYKMNARDAVVAGLCA